MAYITGTLASANPGADLHAAMVPAFATAGYTLVDTVVITTRTHKVYKSAAANNTAGKDFYLAVSYPTTGAGGLSILPMEYFDPATHIAYRMVFASTNTSIEATYWTRFGATGYALDSSNWFLRGGQSTALEVATATSTFGYWLSITGNRIVALTSVQPDRVGYFGLFTPTAGHVAAAGAALYPLIACNIMGSSAISAGAAAAVTAALTRLPNHTTINGWDVSVVVEGAYNTAELPSMPNGNLWIVSSRLLSPVRVRSYSTSVTAQGTFGYLDGLALTPGGGSVARGDTVTVGADTWVLGTPNSLYSYVLKAV